MNNMKDKVEYGTQPAFNQSFLPSAPPSYSDAVSPSPHSFTPSTVVACSDSPQFKSASGSAPAPPPVQYISPPIVQIAAAPPGVAIVAVGPNRARVQCPYCHSFVLTETRSAAQKSAHIACCILFFLGCCLCSCIPYCMKSCKNINHTCPKCNSFIGTYRG